MGSNNNLVVRENLTKENFWNECMCRFPKSTTTFCIWIDRYKKSVNWNKMFAANEGSDQLHSSKYKFHDIPYEMQQGIWIRFAEEELNKLFEQPEYLFYCGDLRDDIIRVFQEMESVL